jgi:hypothetical protein
MSTVKEIYGHIALELIKNSIHSGHIDSEAVYQEANKSNRAIYSLDDCFFTPLRDQSSSLSSKM